jgi:hypothetical protein
MTKAIYITLLLCFFTVPSVAGEIQGWVEIPESNFSIFAEASGPAYRDIEKLGQFLTRTADGLLEEFGNPHKIEHFDVFVHTKMDLYVGPGGGFTTIIYGHPQMHIYYQQDYNLDSPKFREVTANELTKTIFYAINGKPSPEVNNSNVFSWMMEGLGAALQGDSFDGLSCELWSLLAMDSGFLLDISKLDDIPYGEYRGNDFPEIMSGGTFLTFHQKMFYLDEIMLPQMGSFCHYLKENYGLEKISAFILNTTDQNYVQNISSSFGRTPEELKSDWLSWLEGKRGELCAQFRDYPAENRTYANWLDLGMRACKMGVETLKEEGDGAKLALVNECISETRLKVKGILAAQDLEEAQKYIDKLNECLSILESLGEK